MKLGGLQKLTLLDFPGHTACTVFTKGCNFRCPFCHNASLVLSDRGECDDVSEEEFFSFLEKRRGILEGVAVTGGEPTLQKDLKEFLGKIKKMGFAVKLDTNGYEPGILSELIAEGLVDYVAMDIKSSPAGYSKAVGKKDFDIGRIEKSINILKSSPIPFEFRTTAVKGLHTAGDFLAIGKWLGNVENYFIQQFVDSGDLIENGYSAFSKEEMTALLTMARVGTPSSKLRGIKD